ncbi:hypothetical protein CDD81_7876 [Ophiocordyceps australis]|uniref:Nucleolar complex protein 2 n=1 Tax=Ophiocordyceps australis TaxID=1399860 RepID=A0A2C5YF95_9HYPO|nr:hypothetical protein CDD81_7876 [Ophiocordyceps australis]
MGSSKKNLKATKKFEKNHLKGVLDKRKATAKIKQRQQVKDKKKAKRARDGEFYKGAKEEAQPGSKANGTKGPSKVGEMSVDEFFQGGFEELVDPKAGKLGKRKRSGTIVREEDQSEAGSQSQGSDAGEPVVSDDDDQSEVEEEHGMSKATMEALASKDPDFYKFLQENDPDMLDFDEGADLAEVDELSGGEEAESEQETPKKKKKKAKSQLDEEQEEDAKGASSGANELTRALVASWREAMTTGQSLRATRQAVLAFRCAARLNQDEQDDKAPRWTINSPDVFSDILVLALQEIPAVMNHHIPIKESAAGNVYVHTESRKFKTLSMLLKSYTSSILHLLSTLSDDKTIKMTLSALTPILPYLLSFKKLIKALSKAVINYWAQPASSETTRITAFLVVRRLVVIGDKSIRQALLKATYQGLVQACRVTNHNTAQGINLVKVSAAELWGMDAAVGYTTAFAFIRQLAMHLRKAIVNNQNESFRTVYNWQFVHSLDFWSVVLAEHCSPLKEAETAGRLSQLKLLIYPLTQLTLGAMRLIPTAAYFPLRFMLIGSLLRLSRATGIYMPLASPLLEALSSAELRKRPKPSTLKPLDLGMTLRAPKAYLGTRVYQDSIGDAIVDLLGEFLLVWATSIAFPELALPISIQLKRWLKIARSPSRGNRNAKVTSQVALLVQKMEANASFIQERRAKVDFAPRERAQVEAFLKDFDVAKTPLGAFVVAQRQIRAQRAKVLAEARRDDERLRREDEAGQGVESGDEEHQQEGYNDDDDGQQDEDDEDEDGESDEDMDDEDEHQDADDE